MAGARAEADFEELIQLEEGDQTFELDRYLNGLYLMVINVEGKKMVTKQFVVLKKY